MPNNSTFKIRGIVPPLVTPLIDDDTLDVAGLEHLIEHVISGGVHGIFILGTTGEFSGLSIGRKIELIELTCRFTKGRVPVLVGISESSVAESLKLAHKAAECGAEALVLLPPFYFTLTQEELLGFVKRIAALLPLPLFLYNIPANTKVSFSPETVMAASQIPGIVGMKDSSSDLVYLKHVQYALKDNPDFIFLVGPEEFLSEFVLRGGHGGVNGGANLFPKLYVEMYHASVARNFDRIIQLQNTIMHVCTGIYKVGNASSGYLGGLKCALSEVGICNDFLAEPFRSFDEPKKKKIREILENLNYRELL